MFTPDICVSGFGGFSGISCVLNNSKKATFFGSRLPICTTSMEPMNIYQGRWAMIKMAFLFALGVGFSLWVMTVFDSMMRLFCIGGSLVFGLLSLFYFLQSFQKNELVIRLDEKGFHQFDTSIPWSGIESFRIYQQVSRGTMSVSIVLDLTEESRILCGMPTPTSNTPSSVPGDITVQHELVDVSMTNLLATLEKYRIYYTRKAREESVPFIDQPSEHSDLQEYPAYVQPPQEERINNQLGS
ncbi:MAG: hypothetical protein QM758_07130 [Armatimonas sp.]